MHSQLSFTSRPRPWALSNPSKRASSCCSHQVRALSCPYRTLGLEATADDQQIKSAYRRLALRYHPDVAKTTDAAVKFVSIQEAYELLTGRGRGRDRAASSNGEGDWDFHDWYWQFRMSRSWASQHGAAAAETAAAGATRSQPQDRSQLRTQLAGLRHRAAVRGTKLRRQEEEEEQLEQGRYCHEDSECDGMDEPATASAAAAAVEPEVDEGYYDSTEMSDGVYIGPPTTEAVAAPPQRKFTPTEHTRSRVMSQLAGLKRKVVIKQRQRQHA